MDRLLKDVVNHHGGKSVNDTFLSQLLSNKSQSGRKSPCPATTTDIQQRHEATGSWPINVSWLVSALLLLSALLL